MNIDALTPCSPVHYITSAAALLTLHAKTGCCLPWRGISNTCTNSVLINDSRSMQQLFYYFVFPFYKTHWGRDKMAAISQTTFSDVVLWKKMFKFRLKFHWSVFPNSNWQSPSIASDNGLAPNRRQAIIWANAVLCCRRIYASLGLNELKRNMG